MENLGLMWFIRRKMIKMGYSEGIVMIFLGSDCEEVIPGRDSNGGMKIFLEVLVVMICR